MIQYHCRWFHQKVEGSGLLRDVQPEDVPGLIGQDRDLDVSDSLIPENIQASGSGNRHGNPESVCHGLDQIAHP